MSKLFKCPHCGRTVPPPRTLEAGGKSVVIKCPNKQCNGDIELVETPTAPGAPREYEVKRVATPRSFLPVILSGEYNAFLSLCFGAADFPRTYEQCNDFLERESAQRIACGLLTQSVVIHPEEFDRWCRGVGRLPSLGAILDFAVAKAASGSVQPAPRS